MYGRPKTYIHFNILFRDHTKYCGWNPYNVRRCSNCDQPLSLHRINCLEYVKQQNVTLQTKLSDSQTRVRELEAIISKMNGKITIYEGWVIDGIQIGTERHIGGIGGNKKSFDAVF